jgi:CHASE3 domain sensor protein
MDQAPREADPVVGGERTPEQIQAEIDVTRHELGETVAAVAEKADVKSQARRRMDEARQAAQATREELLSKVKASTPESAGAGMQQVSAKARQNPLALAVGGALVVGFLFGRGAGR